MATATAAPAAITTELVSNWTVTSSPPLTRNDEEPTSETLSEVDEWQTKATHWLGFSMRFDATLDAATVKEGLAKTLYHFPALGARVVVAAAAAADSNNPNKLYQLELLPVDDDDDKNLSKQGVVLEYYKGTAASDDCLPDDTHTRQVWKQAGLDAPGPGYSGEATVNDPLLRAKLVVFEQQNISYLCVGINHGIGDGHSMVDLMHVWSQFCTDDEASSLPEHLQQRRRLGQRVTEPVKPAQDTTELYQRMESEIGMPYNPFSLWTLLSRVVPRAVWCMSRQEEVELRIHASSLAALKQAIMPCLDKTKGDDWVSTFEVLCASLLLTEWVTSSSDIVPPSQEHNLHVCCDLRGRAERFPKNYFGNAAFDFCEPMNVDLPSLEFNMESLVPLTQQVHSALRKGLANAETNACKSKDWFEAARHLGLKNQYDIWAPVIVDTLRGDGTFVNSWDKKWLDCNMGSSSGASSMVAWFGTLQNLFVEVPRHAKTGDSTIYLALPPAHAKRFRAFCLEMKEKEGIIKLPFEVV